MFKYLQSFFPSFSSLSSYLNFNQSRFNKDININKNNQLVVYVKNNSIEQGIYDVLIDFSKDYALLENFLKQMVMGHARELQTQQLFFTSAALSMFFTVFSACLWITADYRYGRNTTQDFTNFCPDNRCHEQHGEKNNNTYNYFYWAVSLILIGTIDGVFQRMFLNAFKPVKQHNGLEMLVSLQYFLISLGLIGCLGYSTAKMGTTENYIIFGLLTLTLFILTTLNLEYKYQTDQEARQNFPRYALQLKNRYIKNSKSDPAIDIVKIILSYLPNNLKIELPFKTTQTVLFKGHKFFNSPQSYTSEQLNIDAIYAAVKNNQNSLLLFSISK